MALDGKRILVTGGSGLLGRSLVPLLLDRGAWVAVTWRDNDSLAALLARVPPDGPQPKTVRCELSDADSVERLAEELGGDLPLDGIACLAGGWAGGTPMWEAPFGELQGMLHDNFLSAYRPLHRFLPGMVEAGRGRVVTVAARHVERPMREQAAYTAAKAAVLGLTRGLAEDLRGTGVAAFCLLPSAIGEDDTPRDDGKPSFVPARRVAEVAAWLLDDESAAINGAAVPVTGD